MQPHKEISSVFGSGDCEGQIIGPSLPIQVSPPPKLFNQLCTGVKSGEGHH